MDFWGESLPSPRELPSSPIYTADIPQDENIDGSVFRSGNGADDIANVRNQGFEVDDDNEPVPENIPVDGNNSPQVVLKDGQSWGWDGIDRC